MKSATALVATLLLLSSCGSDPPEITKAIFDVRNKGPHELYAYPYPNDLRRRDDGSIDLAHMATALKKNDLVQRYIDVVAGGKLGGFGLGAGAFLRFSGPIDTSHLPAGPLESTRAGEVVSFVNIDKRSPRYGKRVPFRVQFTQSKGTFIGANHLAVLPVTGVPLDPSTTYAVMVHEHLCDPGGAPVQPDTDFSYLLRQSLPADQAALARAHKVYAPLRAYLADTGLTGVISAAVFTTSNPTALAGKARQVILRRPAPVARDLVVVKQTSLHHELRGWYSAPNFQAGTVPYSQPAHGGLIKVGSDGLPLVARAESMRFAITVPRGAAPASGWPVVLYSHGTGGSYRSFINSKVSDVLASVKDDQGQVISRLAVVGIDQNLHGNRSPSASVATTFFNFLNPAASVHNIVQSGIDNFSLLRMIMGISEESVPWGRDLGKTGNVTFAPLLRFDPDRVYFMGHSQGGLTGPSFLAHEPQVKAAVLSGAGGGAMLSLLHKKKPVDIGYSLELAVGEPLSVFHPLLNLVQQMTEQGDAVNYGRMFIQNPPPRVDPKHILLTQGIRDGYTPNVTTDALALSVGVPLVEPVERKVPLLEQLGPKKTSAPLAGNITASATKVTGALLQYEPVPVTPEKACTSDSDCGTGGDICYKDRCTDDGHFVVFHDPRAIRQYGRFLATLARHGYPTVSP